MPFNILKIISANRNNACRVHGAPSRAVNKTLLAMALVSFSLIIRHVWVHGPAGQAANPEALRSSFPAQLGGELWALLFDSHGIMAELWTVFPYFIVGILLAGYIRTYKLAVKLQAKLRRYGILSVFLASLVGILTPLCACGTLTTAVSLLFAGMPLAPVMSLLVTSPLLSPSTYLLTLNDLGPEWTVIRTISAFSMGIFAGVATHLLGNRGFRTESIFMEGAIPRGDFHDEAYPDERLRCGCRERFGHRVAARTDNMFVIFLAKSSEMIWMVGKYVLVGVAIGAIVERYIPHDWIYRLFGRKDPLNILWITLGSVPVFLHQISASSILYHIKSSLSGTLDGGAALAFMIGGPVTAMPTMVMFWTIFKKRVFALYLLLCIMGTVLIAYAFQFLVFVPYADLGNPLLRHVGSLSGGHSAVIEKRDKHVRVVMDPGGKAIIATSTNDVEGRGGVVLDAGVGRFLDGSAEKYDNRQYIENIATWLDQNSRSPDGKRILIYDASWAPVPGADTVSERVVSVLLDQGFEVRMTDRRRTPLLTEETLKHYGQLWVLFGAPVPGNSLSEVELEAMARFTAKGKGMLISAGKRGPGNDLSAANRVSSRYGVIFSGSVELREELPVTTASYFFIRASDVIGKILKLVNKA